MNTATKTRKRKSAPEQEQHGPIARTHQTWSKGDCAFQGDVIFVCLGDVLPTGSKPRNNRQLAEGSTQGSRHILDGGDCLELPAEKTRSLVRTATGGKVDPTEQCCGPLIVGPCNVRHPQHQDQEFPADTVTAVIYQRNLDSEERERRARD